MKNSLFSILAMLTLGASLSTAQSNTLFASSDINIEETSNESYLLDNEFEDFNNVSESESYDTPTNSSIIKMHTIGLLDINVNSNVKYTKAEILNKDSNLIVKSLPMNEGMKSINISELKPGSYYMILSNDSGDVFSEKIIIL